MWDEWQLDAQGEVVADTDYRTAYREFHYDGLFSRWLTRELDPDNDVVPGTPLTAGDMGTWTDTMGLLPHQDYDVTELTPSSVQVDEQTRYLPAAGLHAQQDLGQTGDPLEYVHGDLLDSTMLTTDRAGNAVNTMAYTAFGEPIGTPADMGMRAAC